MVVICIGPCCVPLHALLPFLVGWAHRRGYLRWVRQEWFTYRWLKPRVKRAFGFALTEKEEGVLTRVAEKKVE
jgi:hypothetical protein